jgi:hypothetical protein
MPTQTSGVRSGNPSLDSVPTTMAISYKVSSSLTIPLCKTLGTGLSTLSDKVFQRYTVSTTRPQSRSKLPEIESNLY